MGQGLIEVREEFCQRCEAIKEDYRLMLCRECSYYLHNQINIFEPFPVNLIGLSFYDDLVICQKFLDNLEIRDKLLNARNKKEIDKNSLQDVRKYLTDFPNE